MADRDDWAEKIAPPRQQGARELDIIDDSLKEFSQYTTYRNTHATEWEEIAELIDPLSRNTFMYGNFNWPGQKKTDRQVDASGMMALGRFTAIVDSLTTPRNQMWHGLEANDAYVMKDRATRLWFEDVTKILFKQRYAAHANFVSQNQAVYRSIGAYGTGGIFIDAFDGRNYGNIRGLRYKRIPLGELFIAENHQGLVDRFTRWYRLTAEQALLLIGQEKFPDALKPALIAKSQQKFDFIHRVVPRDSYDPDMLDENGMPFASYNICLASRSIIQEGGYSSFPLPVTRHEQAPGEVYGRGVASMVLPALKTLNAEKKVFLKSGHRAADPVLLTADDGILDMNMRPGATNKGGVTAEGRPLVLTLPTGSIQITKEMMDEEKGLINDAFLVSLFQIMEETPQMTATEVIERVNEKGILLAPTIGRQQSEYVGPVIDRELDVLAQLHLLPPMPPRLREAGGSYDVVHTSPLARAMKAGEASGFMRTIETFKEIANITQDMSVLDPFDFDTAAPAIAEIQGVPESWMATDEQIALKRKARAQSQERQAQIQAMPAQAAMMKAQATVAKNQPGIAPGEQGAGGPVQPGA